MKIYKNDASIDLSLEDFLDILEQDALEDVLEMLIDLDLSGSISNNHLNNSSEVYYVSGDEFGNILDDLLNDEPEGYAELFFESSIEWDENLTDVDNFHQLSFSLSDEDFKIQRIIESFSHVLL